MFLGWYWVLRGYCNSSPFEYNAGRRYEKKNATQYTFNFDFASFVTLLLPKRPAYLDDIQVVTDYNCIVNKPNNLTTPAFLELGSPVFLELGSNQLYSNLCPLYTRGVLCQERSNLVIQLRGVPL